MQNTPTKIFNKNISISNAINGFVPVPNSVSAEKPNEIPSKEAGLGEKFNKTITSHVKVEKSPMKQPSKQDVQTFFMQNDYPSPEATKFFYYNQSKAWMLTDKIPIKDWQSLAHRWMLNEKKSLTPTTSNLQTNNDKNYYEPL